jgi:hypothetical protein
MDLLEGLYCKVDNMAFSKFNYLFLIIYIFNSPADQYRIIFINQMQINIAIGINDAYFFFNIINFISIFSIDLIWFSNEVNDFFFAGFPDDSPVQI